MSESGLTDTLVPPNDSAAVDGGVLDGTATDDATSDAEVDAADAAACSLPAADPDAGVSGTVQWALRFGVSGGMSPTAVALAPSTGDVVAVGGMQGSADFGGGVLTGTAGYDAFVARFDSSGGYKWARTFGNGSAVAANGIAIDRAGNVVVGGLFEGTVDFGGGPLTAVGQYDGFLVELDSGGTHRWSKSFGVVGQTQNLNAVQVDAAGNVLIGGVARGGLNLGGPALSGYYIAKFDAAGTPVWSKAFSASSTSSSPQIAVDPNGNVLLAGSFSGNANFGGGAWTSGVSADGFVAKYDSSGTYQWAKQFTATDAPAGVPQAVPFAVATDACGNIILSGRFNGTINFGPGPMVGVPSVSNIFLVKIDPAGKGVWSRQFDGSNVNSLGPYGVGLTGQGAPVAAFVLTGSVNFGGGVLTSVGQGSVTLAGLSPTGSYRWAHTGGAPSTASVSGAGGPHALAANSTSAVLLGKFGGPGKTLVFASSTLTSATLSDMFLISLTP